MCTLWNVWLDPAPQLIYPQKSPTLRVKEEKLCFQIKKFRCLYDKASKGYKEKYRVSNAWRSVVR